MSIIQLGNFLSLDISQLNCFLLSLTSVITSIQLINILLAKRVLNCIWTSPVPCFNTIQNRDQYFTYLYFSGGKYQRVLPHLYGRSQPSAQRRLAILESETMTKALSRKDVYRAWQRLGSGNIITTIERNMEQALSIFSTYYLRTFNKKIIYL